MTDANEQTKTDLKNAILAFFGTEKSVSVENLDDRAGYRVRAAMRRITPLGPVMCTAEIHVSYESSRSAFVQSTGYSVAVALREALTMPGHLANPNHDLYEQPVTDWREVIRDAIREVRNMGYRLDPGEMWHLSTFPEKIKDVLKDAHEVGFKRGLREAGPSPAEEEMG